MEQWTPNESLIKRIVAATSHPGVLEQLPTLRRVGIISNMKATLLTRQRAIVAPDAYVEIVIWRLPKRVPASTHSFKYSLAYVVNGKCVLRYDNERGKGDHRHWGASQRRYVFSTPEQLMADFLADVARWNHEHGRA